MVSAKFLGIIFPNNHDKELGELTLNRTCASVPFAGRYRLVDFTLSGFSAAGVEQVAMVVTRNYISLMDHIGSGSEWDFSGKNVGIRLFPPFSVGSRNHSTAAVDSLHGILGFIKDAVEEYVVLADCNIAAMIDYRSLFAAHRQSEADITAVYAKHTVPKELENDNLIFKFDDGGKCTDVLSNGSYGTDEQHNLSMSVFVMKRTLLCDLVNDAYMRNYTSFSRDIVARNSEKLNIRGFEHKGFFKLIYDKKSYYDSSLSLLDGDNNDRLFNPKAPVYTKVRGEAPVRYTVDSKVINSMIADGALIAGTVENSVLFRGVRVDKGAVVRNCVLMQDTVVEAGATMEYVITDKNVTVREGIEVKGSQSYPVYVQKGETV